MINEKEFINKVKLLFSSLFSRTMKYVIVGAPNMEENQFIFSNIPLEEMEFYEQSAEYYLHQVDIKDNDFLHDLNEQWPIFSNSIFIFQTDKFLSIMNKHKGELKDLTLTFDKDDKLIVHAKIPEDIEQECGELISAYTASLYKQLFDKNLIPQQGSWISHNIQEKIAKDDPYTLIPLRLVNNRMVNYVYVNKKSGVSLNEFPQKAKLKQYECLLVSGPEMKTCRVNVKFECDLAKVISVQPAGIWYTKEFINKE